MGKTPRSPSSSRVVIIGPNIYYVTHSIPQAFERLGWTAEVVAVPHVDWHWKNRFGRVLGGTFDIKIAREASFRETVAMRLLPLLDARPPQLLLIVQPMALGGEERDRLGTYRFPIIGWATDSLSHHPGQAALIPVMKRCYFNDGGDAQSTHMHWLPLGFDDALFKPSSEPRLFDILYVGNTSGLCYETRWQWLKKLRTSRLAKRYRVGFVGSSRAWIEAHTARMPGNITWIDHYVPLPRLGELVARSDVVVNVHQDDGDRSVNPMFFAIGGAKVCQAAQSHIYLRDWLRADVDYYTCRDDAFLEDLESLVTDEPLRKRIAQSAYEASPSHTFVARVRRILEDEGLQEDKTPGGSD